MGDRYAVSDENKKILSIDANNLYGQSMSQTLSHDGNEKRKGHLDCYIIELEDILSTPDGGGFVSFC